MRTVPGLLALSLGVLLVACSTEQAGSSPVHLGEKAENTAEGGGTTESSASSDAPSSAPKGNAPTTVAGGFRSLTPVRLLDSRDGTGVAPGAFTGALEAGAERAIDVSGLDALLGPAASRLALQMNVTVTETEGDGFLRVYPCGTSPDVATVTFKAGETVASTAIVDAKTQFCVFSNVATKIVVDATGAFEKGSSLRFSANEPLRIFDSRPTDAKLTSFTIALPGLPTKAAGVVAHVTVTQPDAAGFARVFRCGSVEPETANLNFAAGETIATTTVVETAQGSLCVSASTATHIVVDIEGTFGDAGKLGFAPRVPTRILDSRDEGAPTTSFRFRVPNLAPGTATAALHLTAADVASAGFVTATDCSAPSSATSTVNVEANQVRTSLSFVPISPEGEVCVTSTVPVQLIADLVGVLTP